MVGVIGGKEWRRVRREGDLYLSTPDLTRHSLGHGARSTIRRVTS